MERELSQALQWHCLELFSKATKPAKVTARQSGSRAFALKALWVPSPYVPAQYLLLLGTSKAAYCQPVRSLPWLSLTVGTGRPELGNEKFNFRNIPLPTA